MTFIGRLLLRSTPRARISLLSGCTAVCSANQNAEIERFNRPYCHEVLDVYVLKSTEQVQLISALTTPWADCLPSSSYPGYPPATVHAIDYTCSQNWALMSMTPARRKLRGAIADR